MIFFVGREDDVLYLLLFLLNILNIDLKRELSTVILLIKTQGKVDCKDFNDRSGSYVIDLI